MHDEMRSGRSDSEVCSRGCRAKCWRKGRSGSSGRWWTRELAAETVDACGDGGAVLDGHDKPQALKSS